MNIREFCARHGNRDLKRVDQVVTRWGRERELDKLLHAQVAAGVVLGDVLVGDGLIDQISPELRHAFAELMGGQASSYSQVRQILLDKLENGDPSVLGLVNKIKGQIGENRFMEELGGVASARLATLGNQEAWDVAVDHDWGTQYVQVKMYSNADGVVRHMKEVQAKLTGEGRIWDGDIPVQRIDFAVPADIAEEVARKAEVLGLDMRVLPIQMSANEAAEIVWDGVNKVGPEALENFFGELLGIAGNSAVGHGVVSAFLVYKGAKQREEVLGEISQNTAISVGGAAAGGVMQVLLNQAGLAAGPVGVAVLVTSISARAVLRRLAERTGYVEFLKREHAAIRQLARTFSPPTAFRA